MPSSVTEDIVCCAACGKNVMTFTLRSQANWQLTNPNSSAAQQGHPDVSLQGAGGKVSALDLDNALHDAQQLLKAAERIVMESCGEKWLLQPFIPDMEANEYRYVHVFPASCHICCTEYRHKLVKSIQNSIALMSSCAGLL